ncbi:hypothetical protein GC197_13590 [bacterium]|nr:hypothetical protein [bacterium]
MQFRLVSWTITLLAFWASTGTAEDPKLGDQFGVPEQGHIELRQCWIDDLKDPKLNTVQDVLNLARRIEAIPFDEPSILSGNLLEKIGLSSALPNLPMWTKWEVDFKPGTCVQRSVQGRDFFVIAKCPAADIDISGRAIRTQINHRNAGGQNVSLSDVSNLFGRNAQLFQRPYVARSIDQAQLAVIPLKKFERIYVTRPDQDRIEANMALLDQKVFAFQLYLYQQEPAETVPFWLPRLVLEFQKVTAEKCSVTLTLIDKANFAAPVDPGKLKIPVKAGWIYAHQPPLPNYAKKMPIDLEDLSIFTPAQAKTFIDTLEDQLRRK